VTGLLLTAASLALAYRIHRKYSAPAEDGGNHRKETEQSALSQ
jgi:hypothetical protein